MCCVQISRVFYDKTFSKLFVIQKPVKENKTNVKKCYFGLCIRDSLNTRKLQTIKFEYLNSKKLVLCFLVINLEAQDLFKQYERIFFFFIGNLYFSVCKTNNIAFIAECKCFWLKYLEYCVSRFILFRSEIIIYSCLLSWRVFFFYVAHIFKCKWDKVCRIVCYSILLIVGLSLIYCITLMVIELNRI